MSIPGPAQAFLEYHGALVRVAASGALERSREIAIDYARRAQAALNGEVWRGELDLLADAVVDRQH
jgi:hypothetical protein